ncbi:YebC/PmpR family DNA-binding transcriptional regulator [soil metagenome]|nr:YebC/PmpR family DNA-binding transcriptional regulator [Trueperaceae bacterium]
MAGHNKWSQIKRKKAANDNQRGKVISKHIRAIQTAVREGGGGDPSANLGLKNSLAAAKSDNVPVDNIDRAIERGLGAADGSAAFETVLYEGYGPHGVAVLVEALTDNRNRTAGEVRHVFTKLGGNLSGSVAWQFESRGVIVVPSVTEALTEHAIEAGALDLEADEEATTLYTAPTDLYAIVDVLQAAGFDTEVAQLTKVPQTLTPLEAREADRLIAFVEALEDLDDVQNVHTTADLEHAGTLVG